jgi:para-aminobenzoate synthetase component 1
MANLLANSQVHEHSLIELPVMHLPEFVAQLNAWGAARLPFFFMIDFEMKKPWAVRLEELYCDKPIAWFDFPGISNHYPTRCTAGSYKPALIKYPIPEVDYRKRFDKVMHHLQSGDTYLLNLTCKTRVKINCSPEEIFFRSSAKYKIHVPGRMVVFSPETFITITGSTIRTFPMKGTMDASVPDAATRILQDEKEKAEHVTIVDLLRNDLSRVARKVEVKRFRYIEEIAAGKKRLLQVSSEIAGLLPDNYQASLGDILTALLPAGSVSGAPKARTIEIISEAEGEDRGYFTGVCGVFDGETLDSTVMIRFIEMEGNELFYRSGGGITSRSNPKIEYDEMQNKIYFPIIPS